MTKLLLAGATGLVGTAASKRSTIAALLVKDPLRGGAGRHVIGSAAIARATEGRR